ncbi:Rbp6 [Symbiodinium pilosum]|uniref:Rbp6 protein n=1 Tax=Symbiodinium pilosum TaxID=2952 RepID=A0A812YJA9_SYMPI|nr:Rbp6 [Symbiodinium pilosum]
MEGADSCTLSPICPGKVTSSNVEGVSADGKPQLPAVAAKNARNQNSRAQRRRTATDCATQEDQCHPRKIFIGGLAHKTTTQHLRDYFVKYGGIVDAVVLRWPDGRSRGFGYVTFSEAQGAQGALNDAHQIGGRQVDVKRAVPGTNKLFVGGLPQNTAAAELREHFEAFGTVSDAVVMIDPATNRSRGFGFVCFLPGQEGAASAAFALEQYEHHRIRGKWIEVKSAAPPHKLAKDGAASSPSAASESGGPQLCLSSPAASPTASPLAGSPQSGTSAATPQVMSLAQALRMPLKGQSPTAGPQTQERPVASPQHRNRSVRNVGLPSKSLEPQKVMLPGAVGSPPGLGATAAAALAAMRALGSPPGLESPEDAKAEPEACPWSLSPK